MTQQIYLFYLFFDGLFNDIASSPYRRMIGY